MDLFGIVTSATYWAAAALWLAVILLLARKLRVGRMPRLDGTISILVAILMLDAARTLFENLYFGLYWSSSFGLLPAGVQTVLERPALQFLPKALTVLVALIVIFVLLRRWFPLIERERAAMAAELAQNRQEAAIVAAAMGEAATPIAVVDTAAADLPTLYVNRALHEMLGPGARRWTPGGEAWGIRPADAEAGAELARMRRAIEQGQATSGVVRHRDPPRALQINISPTPPRPGTGARLCVVTFRDVTAQRAAEEKLEQAFRLEALGQITGGIAHDFNNLLTVIAGNAEYAEHRLSRARADAPAPDGSTETRDAEIREAEVREALRTVRQAGERGAALIRQLLAFARQQPLPAQPVDVNHALRELQGLLRSSLGPEITLDCAFEPDIPPVLADPGGLENAVLNLCINARDAMPDGGRVRLATRGETLSPAAAARIGAQPGPHVAVEVADQGTGIPEPLRARIFEPFFTTKPEGRGSGLGLAMVYGFVRQSGGGIDVSGAAGGGTVVTLWLPVAKAVPETGSDGRAAPGTAESKGGGT